MKIEFPKPFRYNGRLYWRRSELELYKSALIASAMGGNQNVDLFSGPEIFVNAEQVAKEFAITRRTLGRRIAGFDKPSLPRAA
ncbi:hypothetical protein Rvan_2485 [Rhodomicrobium vannielii ATCC 17100]|uniref:Uncharacterized protein n=1 Tax=Rhodomicrobium vannielii (strain ATCC 17100 / DSM 162 / LMG 4299 / NCIMB 10020 / ATH 3.1.1) TaxID=648757 RepID=E3I5H9_RHOVT|nr:hypothetical protein [Rhodomicrobium vannielii]ADP71700.1 hypothetical protein Rvan_2485 [Rhodomicrobium vannielii ATCC 17100]